jgi:hypothetical protein
MRLTDIKSKSEEMYPIDYTFDVISKNGTVWDTAFSSVEDMGGGEYDVSWSTGEEFGIKNKEFKNLESAMKFAELRIKDSRHYWISQMPAKECLLQVQRDNIVELTLKYK